MNTFWHKLKGPLTAYQAGGHVMHISHFRVLPTVVTLALDADSANMHCDDLNPQQQHQTQRTPAMPLSRIMYYSTVTPGFAPDLSELLAVSHKNNQRDAITGFLYFNTSYFLQVIEGERATLNALYRRISADRRHTDLILISSLEISDRAFPAWLMGLREGRSAETDHAFRQSLGTLTLNPDTITADQFLELMQRLALDALSEMAE